MKHVFILNSHTTYLTAIGVIAYLHLEISDIIMVLVRNYTNDFLPGDFVIWDASSLSYESEKVFNRRNFWRSPKINFIKRVDATINSYISESFHLYAPHLAHPLWTIMYTNEKCEYFSYIQEGCIPFSNAYVSQTPLKGLLKNFLYDKISNGRVWFYRPWYLRDKIKDCSKIDAYAINYKFFSHLPAKVNIVKWPVPPKKISIDFQVNHTIFIFDAFVTHNLIKEREYLSMCKELIKSEASEHNYIKFHPGQSENEKKEILSFFRASNLTYYVLDDSIPFEYVIMMKKNLKFAGFGSSLLFLAYDFGHKVICRDDDLLSFKLYSNYRSFCGFMSFKQYTTI